METFKASSHVNHYPAINVSGNARAIIGNVYGLDCEVINPPAHNEQRSPRLKSLQANLRQEPGDLAVIFGGLPVLLLQDYEEVRSSINVVRNLDKEIEKCAKHLGVRQAILQQSLKELLGTCVGLDVAQQMLCDSSHSTWADGDFAQNFQDRYGTNLAAVCHALGLISHSLEGIMWFGEKCALLQDEDTKVSILSS